MAGTHDAAADEAAFSRRLEALKPVPVEPTLNEFDRYAQTTREAELDSQVCKGDCLIALASAELKRLLCLTAIRASRPLLTVILGQHIVEDKGFLDYVKLFFPDEVSVVSSASPLGPGTFKGICLVDPNVMRSWLATDHRKRYTVGALIFLDFQHYLDPYHVYRYIMGLYHNAHGVKEATKTRLLAFADDLHAKSVRNLESILRNLRTPLRLRCGLGTPDRPHVKELEPEVTILLLEADWMSALGPILSSPDDTDVQEVKKTLRERGVVAAQSQAEKAAAANPSRELRQFLLHARRLMLELKQELLLAIATGRTLALTNAVSSQREIKESLEKSKVTVIDAPHDETATSPVVLVATMADVPTMRHSYWDIVVFCDLPIGVPCDSLLFHAGRAVALATEPERKRWKEVTALHDELDKLLLRVNS